MGYSTKKINDFMIISSIDFSKHKTKTAYQQLKKLHYGVSIGRPFFAPSFLSSSIIFRFLLNIQMTPSTQMIQ